MTKDEAQAWIEGTIQPRVVSVDKLITMAEKIPIDPALLTRKMNIEGVPLDEQKLYLPYAVATEREEEMGKILTQIVDDYVHTDMTEIVLNTKINDLATLNGTVKQTLGVDWIVYSPEERALTVQLANMRRVREAGTTTEGGTTVKLMTTDKLISISEDVPVAVSKLKETMLREGVPADEQRLLVADSVAAELKEEFGRLVTELLTDVSNKLITIAQFTAELNNIATLGNTVKGLLGVDWIIYSPQERSILVALARLRLARSTK